MVKAIEATEGKFINAEMVEKSIKKSLVITGAGDYEKTDYGMKLSLPVEIDGKQKTWCPNIDSSKNLVAALGEDTINWVGKPIKLAVMNALGKKTVIGTAI
jgi:hypothetical protein